MNTLTLDQELHELNSQIIQLGTLVKHALARALGALETGDQDQAGAVVMEDTPIDDLHLAIEEHTLHILSLHQPRLGARDIRFLASAPPIGIDLEHMGDEAAGIAQYVLRMLPLRTQARATGETSLAPDPAGLQPTGNGTGNDQLHETLFIQRLLAIGQEVVSLIHRTMKAFSKRDAQAARSIWEQDISVHRHEYTVHHDLMAVLADDLAMAALDHDPHILQRVTYLLWIGYELGRIADHCANICERIVFIVESETDILAPLD